MNRLSPQTRISLKELAQRIDRAASHLNVLLFLIAIGLATLDFTLYVTEKVIDNLPPITRVADTPQQSSPQAPGQ